MEKDRVLDDIFSGFV